MLQCMSSLRRRGWLHRHVSAMTMIAVDATSILEEPAWNWLCSLWFLIAKSIFQVHGIDAAGRSGHRSAQLSRDARILRSCRRAWWASRPCLVGMTGRGSSRRSATRSRSITGATKAVRQKRQKNDATDAEAICGSSSPGRVCGSSPPTCRATERSDAPSHAASVHSPADCGVLPATGLISPSSALSRRSAGRCRGAADVVANANDKRVPGIARRRSSAWAGRSGSRSNYESSTAYHHGLASIA